MFSNAPILSNGRICVKGIITAQQIENKRLKCTILRNPVRNRKARRDRRHGQASFGGIRPKNCAPLQKNIKTKDLAKLLAGSVPAAVKGDANRPDEEVKSSLLRSYRFAPSGPGGER